MKTKKTLILAAVALLILPQAAVNAYEWNWKFVTGAAAFAGIATLVTLSDWMRNETSSQINNTSGANIKNLQSPQTPINASRAQHQQIKDLLYKKAYPSTNNFKQAFERISNIISNAPPVEGGKYDVLYKKAEYPNNTTTETLKISTKYGEEMDDELIRTITYDTYGI